MIRTNNEITKKTEHFDTLLPKGKMMYSPKEVAELIGMSPQFVRDLIDSNQLLAHKYNSKHEFSRNINTRRHVMIPRDKILLFLLSTANYEPEEFMTQLKELLNTRPMVEIKRVLKDINKN